MLKIRNTTDQEIIANKTLFRPVGFPDNSHDIPKEKRFSWAKDKSTNENLLNGNLILTHAGDDVVDGIEALNILRGETVKLEQQNPETLAINSTPRYSRPGMLQRIHETEWETCIAENEAQNIPRGRVHDRDHNNQDTGWSTVEYYELVNGEEILINLDDSITYPSDTAKQNKLNADCIRSDFHWEPDVDYMVLSGMLRQKTVPDENIYFWGLFANVKFDGSDYGLPVEVLSGGMNLAFNKPLVPFGMKGVSASSLYAEVLDDGQGNIIPVGPNMGCNRISFIFRHPPGFKHRINAVFEIFR
jgi:hypothetical protein